MSKEERVEWALYHAEAAGREDTVASILAAEVYRLRGELGQARDREAERQVVLQAAFHAIREMESQIEAAQTRAPSGRCDCNCGSDHPRGSCS